MVAHDVIILLAAGGGRGLPVPAWVAIPAIVIIFAITIWQVFVKRR